MKRENLRPVFRWMPLWLLRVCFALGLIAIVLPAAIWDAIKDVISTISQDWRDLHAELERDE